MKLRLVLDDFVLENGKMGIFVMRNGVRSGTPSWHTRFVRHDGRTEEYLDYAFGLTVECGYTQANVRHAG